MLSISKRLAPIIVLAILILARAAASAAVTNEVADTTPPPGPVISNRLTIAILAFQNKTGAVSNDFWRFAPERLLSIALHDVKSLRVLPSASYALRQVNKKNGDYLDADTARQAGAAIEARRVIWGNYSKQGELWQMTVHILNVAPGNISRDLAAASTNWFDLSDQIAGQILQELDVHPSKSEQEEINSRFTSSPLVFELMVKCFAMENQNASLADIEGNVRRAAALDPQSTFVQRAAGALQFSEGKWDASEKSFRSILKIKPNDVTAHEYLGLLLIFQEKLEAAESELFSALRLDPDDGEAWMELGELRSEQQAPFPSLEAFNNALLLNPYDPTCHAHIAVIYMSLGRTEDALAELQKAEKIASPDNAEDQESLAHAFEELHDAPSAINHYQQVISIGKKTHFNPPKMAEYEAKVKELKSRLNPVYFSASPPRDYTESSLRDALQAKLTEEEMKLATNPLACTAPMTNWAITLTAGATNDLQKAQKLFDTLSHHVADGYLGTRTAEGVFIEWNKPGVAFFCQEYAYLYVALARAVGIKAYDVFVSETIDGAKDQHACAAVFIADKLLLVDPMYYWFGAPHKKFQVVDDVQNIALHLSQQHQVIPLRIAEKLAPELPLITINLIGELAAADQWDEARRVPTDSLRANDHKWFWDFVQAQFALHDGKAKRGIEVLKQCLKENPNCSQASYALGSILAQQGNLAEARAAYRDALRGLDDEKSVKASRQAIAFINEKLGNSGAQEEFNDPTAMGYLARGDALEVNKKYPEAISEYTKAIQLGTTNAEIYLRRGFARQMSGDSSKALEDYDQSLRIDPDQLWIYETRYSLYYYRSNFPAAYRDGTNALRLGTQSAEVCSSIAWIVDFQPEISDIADKHVAIVAATKVCELTEWKNGSSLNDLALAYGYANNVAEAINTEKKALKQSDAIGDLKTQMESNLQYWQTNQVNNLLSESATAVKLDSNVPTSTNHATPHKEQQTPSNAPVAR